jgi:hypothetical protein
VCEAGAIGDWFCYSVARDLFFNKYSFAAFGHARVNDITQQAAAKPAQFGSLILARD